ncbi:FG-GAP-like repeat-containing protein [bacterium]|nr:FG-GAP-like repeat-containing protein [bacterium]
MKKWCFLIVLIVYPFLWIGIQGVNAQEVRNLVIEYPSQYTVLDWHCHELRWTGPLHNPNTVNIKISTDNGETWDGVYFHDSPGLPAGEAYNDGYVTWEPPHVWTKQAIIRIEDPSYPSYEYAQSQAFSIQGPEISQPEILQLVSPQAGDSFFGGYAVEIKWNSNYFFYFNLKIEFSDDGGKRWTVISRETENDGSLSWRIPIGLNSEACFIRISHESYGYLLTDIAGPFTIKQNTGGAYFRDVSSNAGIELNGTYRCVSWVDLNQDKFLDLFITGTDEYPNVAYLNNQDGTFSKVSLQAEVKDIESNDRAAVFGDINNDGYPDLYLGGENGYSDKLLLNNGDGTFHNITDQAGIEAYYQETNDVAFLDYDLDGDLDIYVCMWKMHNLLYRNEGNGTFTEVSAVAGVGGEAGASTSAVTVGDYDRDRYPDLYVVNSGNEGNVLFNNNYYGPGLFKDMTDYSLALEWSDSRTAEWGDFNNDGLLDLYVVRSGDSNRLIRFNYNGQFTDITEQAGVGYSGEGFIASLADFDCDGRQDICVGNEGSNGTGKVLLYLQNSEGSFDELGAYSGFIPMNEPRGMASGDYDNDGDLDLFIVNSDGPSRLYQNIMTDQNNNHFLKVRLTGVLSNRDAIGARVLILNGDDRQVREVQVGTGYGNGNSLEVEFGLGQLDSVENMIVFWPSGIVQRFSGLLADSVYCIREIPDTTHDVIDDTLRIIYPITGTLFQSGSTEEIIWESTGNIDSVSLEYSIDGGKTFYSIAAVENNGLFNWSIPQNLFSDSCYIRISDAQDGSHVDMSGLFKIEFSVIPFCWEISEPEQKAGDSFWITCNLGSFNQQVYSMMNLSGTGQFSFSDYVSVIADSIELGSMWGNHSWVHFNVDTLQGRFSFEFQRSIGEGGFDGFGQVIRVLLRSKVNTPDSTIIIVKLDSLSLRDTEWVELPTSADSLKITILNAGLIVWPGDTDNDGIVNQEDVLPLGLYWQAEGPVRDGLSLDWIGQKCIPWIPIETTFSDGNGDGQVNLNDLTSIRQNWIRKHNDSAPVFPLGEMTSDGKIYLQVTDHVPYTPFSTDILLSGESNLFGMALNFCYYKDKIEIDSVEVGSFWGNEHIFLYSDNSDSGKVSIGISLKAVQSGQGGNGVLARIWMRVKEDVPVNQPIIFRIEDMVAVNSDGESLLVTTENAGFVTTGVGSELIQKPVVFRLYANYPNPFNPTTIISYDIPRDVPVLLKIYDLLGHEVRTLVDEKQKSGNYSIEWDGRDNKGIMVSSGIYIYKIVAGDQVSTKKCMLMK